jgi:hypothetical protein
MAGVIGRYSNSTGISLTGATLKTVVQITAPTNQMVVLRSIEIGFAGTFADGDDWKLRVLTQSTAGTMSAATEVHNDSGRNLTLQAAVTHTASAEPTAGSELWCRYGSLYSQRNTLAVVNIPVVEATRLGIEVTADVAATCYIAIVWEE